MRLKATATIALAGVTLGVGAWAWLGLRDAGTSGVPGVVTLTAPPATSRALTLLEAWDAGERQWRSWPGSWRVTSVFSIDVGDDANADTGRDGRRRSWQIELVGDGGVRWMRLLDGTVVMAVDPLAGAPAPAGGPGPIDRPALDSPAAVGDALRLRPSFAGGSDKAIGFHFALTTDEKGTRLEVLGSAGGYPARVAVDGATGALVEAKRQTAAGATYAVSADGLTWSTADLGLQTERALLGTAGGEAYLAAATTAGELAIQHWAGAASGWATVATAPGTGRLILFDLAVWTPPGGAPELVIAANSGLWSFLPAKATLLRWAEEAPVQRLLVDAAGALHLQAVIAPGVSVHAVASADHTLERQAGPEIVRLGVKDGAVLALTSDVTVDEAAGVFLWQADLSASTRLYSLAGTFAATYRRAAGGPWKPVLAEQAIGLAASADGNRLALATLAGVFASDDAGASWRGVLPGGRDFTWSVAYAGGSFLAARGGNRQWQDFDGESVAR